VLPKSSDVRDHDNKQGFAGLRDSVQSLQSFLSHREIAKARSVKKRRPKKTPTGPPLGLDPRGQSRRMGRHSPEAGRCLPGAPGREPVEEPGGAIACFKNAPSAWTRERNPKELAAAHTSRQFAGRLRRVAGEPSIQWRHGSAAPANALPTRLAEPVGGRAATTPVLEDCFLTHARRCQCHVPGKPKSGNLPLRGSECHFDNQNDTSGRIRRAAPRVPSLVAMISASAKTGIWFVCSGRDQLPRR